jgi:hypothetical protein
VSRSDSRIRHDPRPSGTTTRAPKLKSKRSPFGPACVGSSAGSGKCGFGGGSTEVEAGPDAEALGAEAAAGSADGAGAGAAGSAEGAGPGAPIAAGAEATKEGAGAIREKDVFGSGLRLGRSLSGGLDKAPPIGVVGKVRPASEPTIVWAPPA